MQLNTACQPRVDSHMERGRDAHYKFWAWLKLFCPLKETINIFITSILKTGDPCNLIGSQQGNLFTNRTIFCSKSHPLLAHQNDNEIIVITNQIS